MFSRECLLGEKMGDRNLVKRLFMTKNARIRNRIEAFRAGCCKEAAGHPGRIWGNKITTEHLMGLRGSPSTGPADYDAAMKPFFELVFRDTKVLFILRDGRACVSSKVKRTGQPLETACRKWNYSVAVARYLTERHKHLLVIRFEDLLRKPIEILSRVCSFLDVPYEENMIQGTMNDKIPSEYRKDALDVSKASTPYLPEEYFNLIKGNLLYCGYIS